jgi:hypothetical protein
LVGDGGGDHVQAVGDRRDIDALLVGRISGNDPEDAIQVELGAGSIGEQEMPVVRGIEGAAEQA